MKKKIYILILIVLILSIGGYLCWDYLKEPSTEEKLNEIESKSITLISPNGSKTFKKGEMVEIGWNTTDIDGEVLISLLGFVNPFINPGKAKYIECLDTDTHYFIDKVLAQQSVYQWKIPLDIDEQIFPAGGKLSGVSKHLVELLYCMDEVTLTSGNIYDDLNIGLLLISN